MKSEDEIRDEKLAQDMKLPDALLSDRQFAYLDGYTDALHWVLNSSLGSLADVEVPDRFPSESGSPCSSCRAAETGEATDSPPSAARASPPVAKPSPARKLF